MPTNTQGVLRARPRVNVTRGYPGNETEAITASLPVTGTVLSGQALERTSANKFQQANNTTAATSVYIAYHDSDDTDVLSGGKLLGFAAIGEFEIESAYADLDGLAVGDALAVADNGLLTKQGLGTTGSTIGYVTEIRDLGVGGHTQLNYSDGSGNPRGGVPGTIPEDSTSGTYAADSAAAASSTIASSANGSAITSVVAGEEVTLIDAAGLDITYKITDTGVGGNATGTVESGVANTSGAVIAVGLNLNGGAVDEADVMNEIAAAVVHNNGHKGTITKGAAAVSAAAVTSLTFTQATAGADGNTAVVTDLDAANSTYTFPNFGGVGGSSGSDKAIKIVKFVTSV